LLFPVNAVHRATVNGFLDSRLGGSEWVIDLCQIILIHAKHLGSRFHTEAATDTNVFIYIRFSRHFELLSFSYSMPE
jgi:hypothetical protein